MDPDGSRWWFRLGLFPVPRFLEDLKIDFYFSAWKHSQVWNYLRSRGKPAETSDVTRLWVLKIYSFCVFTFSLHRTFFTKKTDYITSLFQAAFEISTCVSLVFLGEESDAKPKRCVVLNLRFLCWWLNMFVCCLTAMSAKGTGRHQTSPDMWTV